MLTPKWSHRRAVLVALGLALLLLSVLGVNRGLWTPDEPREAEIGREMLLVPTVIPTLDGQPFIEKPPLYYWAVAAAYRVAGAPSALAARMVSVIAGVATLCVVFLWVARSAGLLAAALAVLLLATSVQFAISTHWVLLDPLLMLFTTLAMWAAWELLTGTAHGARLRAAFYSALVLALWTKGPIGVVLVGAGLFAYVIIERPRTWRRLHPLGGVAILLLAVLMLAAAIGWQGGRAALWEWAWVNQVQRLVHPLGRTGHNQPLLYYTWTLPYALLPWVVVFIDALRPVHWRRDNPHGALWRFGAISCAAMLLVLSLAATKRETYLLPLLPLIFIWLGIHAAQWWRRRHLGAAPGPIGWAQPAVLALFALAPAVAVCIWQRRVDPLALLWFAAAVAVIGLLMHASWRRLRARAALCAMGCALIAIAALLTLASRALNHMKDMGPFVASIGRELPADTPVYATGIDETLRAIVPFQTGRRLVVIDPVRLGQPGSPVPRFILVQDNRRGVDHGAAALPPPYMLERRQAFGPGRELQLWRRQP